jgi:hypothetical protein
MCYNVGTRKWFTELMMGGSEHVCFPQKWEAGHTRSRHTEQPRIVIQGLLGM